MGEGYALSRATVAAAFLTACRYDVLAFKPGNVSIAAAGHRMRASDFLSSARAASTPLTAIEHGLGAAIREAVIATRSAVGCNTNLGIVLLAVPLAHAALRVSPAREFTARVQTTLATSTVADTRDVYTAIRMANPGGLGASSEHDVRGEPTLDLVSVMRVAAARDTIAAEYASNFSIVFGEGIPRLRAAYLRTNSLAWGVVGCYLHLLAAYLDSHIVRKHGAAVATAVQARARTVTLALEACENRADRYSLLVKWDAELKNEGVNPGTSADLTVASLLALQLDTALKINSGGHVALATREAPR